jgi:class 3 adenylate cyclase
MRLEHRRPAHGDNNASDSPSAKDYENLVGHAIASRAAVQGERKQVTVLFADLKDSMQLLADHDPEEARTVLDPVLELMMQAVHRYEGTVSQIMGDGIMALFGAPIAQENHAVRACYAAVMMQALVRRYAEQLRETRGIPIEIRVGLNSGEAVLRSVSRDLRTDYTAVGRTTHLAARMEQVATAGSVLMTATTLRLVEGYVTVRALGEPRLLDAAEMQRVVQRFRTYGRPRRT